MSTVRREMLKRLRLARRKPNMIMTFVKALVQKVWSVQMLFLLIPECQCRNTGCLLLCDYTLP